MVNTLDRLKILINSSTPIVVMETLEEMRAVGLARTACADLAHDSAKGRSRHLCPTHTCGLAERTVAANRLAGSQAASVGRRYARQGAMAAAVDAKAPVPVNTNNIPISFFIVFPYIKSQCSGAVLATWYIG